MDSAQAETGRVGLASRFSTDDLVKRGVSIEGDFQFDDDGDGTYVRWVHPHHEGGSDSAITIGAPGHPGQVARRLTGPVQFVRKLIGSWDLSVPDATVLLGHDLDDFEHVSAVLDGREQFRGRDVRDRIAHLFCIRRALWSLFRDLDVENEWLREQHRMLSEKSPLSLMLEGSMESLLLVREYVDSAVGIR